MAARRATLVSPTTGERVAIEVGSPAERALFAEGFQLETVAPALPTTFEKPGAPSVVATAGTPEAQKFLAGGFTPQVDVFRLPETPTRGAVGPGGPTIPSLGGKTGLVVPVDAFKQFQLAKMKLLTQAQQGFSVLDLIAREAELKRKSIEAQQKGMKAEDALKFATPSQQIDVAEARAALYTAQLPDTREALKAREAQFGIFKDLFDIASDIEDTMIDQQQQAFQNKLAVQKQALDQMETISKMPGGFANFLELPDEELNAIAVSTGLPLEALKKIAQYAQDNPERDIKTFEDRNGNVVAKDINTGETIWEEKGLAKGFKAGGTTVAGLSKTQKATLTNYLKAVQGASSRENALISLEEDAAIILNEVGEAGLLALANEVDRLFPVGELSQEDEKLKQIIGPQTVELPGGTFLATPGESIKKAKEATSGFFARLKAGAQPFMGEVK